MVSEIRDLGSGKNLFRIPDPGVKKAPDPGSATLVSRSLKVSLVVTIEKILLKGAKP